MKKTSLAIMLLSAAIVANSLAAQKRPGPVVPKKEPIKVIPNKPDKPMRPAQKFDPKIEHSNKKGGAAEKQLERNRPNGNRMEAQRKRPKK